ncbi:MAG: protein kinase domain-containing protein, partial [Planctomycetota bacterium]
MDEQSILLAALEREDPAKRAAFLEEACAGAPELRQRVETLLRAHEHTSTFMEETAAPVAATVNVAVDRVGRVISHYRLDERVGAGGMGEVYRAYDLALGRDCALKILRSGFPSHLRDRLLREAQTCARLQHPGIATFFEAGEAEGEAFIAMEYVLGQTLRERLRQGPLPVDLAMTMTARLLEALGHAHALGILHRDIKPENVMLAEDGSMKLLDFGIAKDVGPVPDVNIPTLTSLTQHGAIVGTVGYMSPEQLRSDPLDARSDLFSVGAVLYEVVAGRPAFPGATPTERIAAILSKDPAPLTGPGIPTEINAVLSRALDRDPASRYESASALMRDLRRVGSGEMAAPLLDSVAVLDFENLSRDAEDDWIGAAMAESLTADLSRLPGLQVPPRQKILGAKAARQAAGAPTDPHSLGLALSCRWLVSGTFQKAGSALRLTVRLTETLTDHEVLTEKMDGSTETLFEMQDRLAALVGDRLNRAAPSREQETAPPPKLSAYECYVKGQHALGFQRGSSEQARELFAQAVDLDPEYAPALAGLAAVDARDHI